MANKTALPAQQDLFGLTVDALSMAEAIGRCTDTIERGGYLSIGVINAAKVVAMRRNPALRQAVADCDIILADGQSVVWASRLLGSPLPERVAGIDLFMELLAKAARRSFRVYFLGARPEILRRTLAEVSRRFPGLAIAGARDGYYSADEMEQVAADIRQSGADLLFVGMSSPRKELFLSRWGESSGVKVVHGVGGSFDILAGLTRRAPIWYQRHGLEWLYRAQQEPIRLGRRYLTTNVAFLLLVAAEAAHRRDRARPGAGSAAARRPAQGERQ